MSRILRVGAISRIGTSFLHCSLRACLNNRIHCRSRREAAQISNELAKNQSLLLRKWRTDPSPRPSPLRKGRGRRIVWPGFVLFGERSSWGLTSAPTILRHALHLGRRRSSSGFADGKPTVASSRYLRKMPSRALLRSKVCRLMPLPEGSMMMRLPMRLVVKAN